MGMWFFSLFSCLLIPGTMVFFGLLWKKRPPKDVNPLYGYRTSMSSKSPATWAFAHAVVSRLWRRWGIVSLCGSLACFILGSFALAGWRWADLCAPEAVDAQGILLLIIVTIQLILFIGSIFPVERALKRAFHSDGTPRA